MNGFIFRFAVFFSHHMIKGVPKKVFLSEMRKFVSKSLNKIPNHPFKDIHVKIYTIGYYSGFYSSLTDKNVSNPF
jgi:hypothetical protein